jgi:hypothetical protein
MSATISTGRRGSLSHRGLTSITAFGWDRLAQQRLVNLGLR